MPVLVKAIAGAGLLALAAAPASAWPGCEIDLVSAAMESDTLVVVHDDAVYNCCLDDVEFQVSLVGSILFIREVEVLTESCPCLCCYELTVRVTDLPPGELEVRLAWDDYDTGYEESWTDTVIVPADGSGTGAVVAGANLSECLDPLPAPVPPEASSWGRVKSRYR